MAISLRGLKVVICAGTGGVGKTTISAALGLRLAQSGLRVLALTIDPARRLAGALGLQSQAAQPVRVNCGECTGELFAEMIEPRSVFEDFVRRNSPSPQAADRLIGNRLFKELSTTLSGSQEFTAQEKLLLAAESGEYDIVILDTPPSQHAIDFLRAPERIFVLFQESVTRWFTADKKKGLIEQIFYKGTQTALAALERITGSEFLHELSDFFVSVSSIQKAVAQRSIAVQRLLTSADTGFLLITAFDDAKIKEAMEFSSDMKRSGHRMRGLVINRSFPQWLEAGQDRRVLAAGDEGVQRLMDFYSKLSFYYLRRQELQQDALTKFHDSVEVVRIPELQEDLTGIDGLAQVSEFIDLDI